MTNAPASAPARKSATGWLIALVAAVSLVALAMVGLVALDPGFLVALVPGWSTGPTSVGRTLQVVGGVTLLIPVTAAMVAHLRGRSRAAGWFLVLAVVAAAPAGLAILRGTAEVRQASYIESPDPQRCVEHSGGDTTCPGG